MGLIRYIPMKFVSNWPLHKFMPTEFIAYISTPISGNIKQLNYQNGTTSLHMLNNLLHITGCGNCTAEILQA